MLITWGEGHLLQVLLLLLEFLLQLLLHVPLQWQPLEFSIFLSS